MLSPSGKNWPPAICRSKLSLNKTTSLILYQSLSLVLQCFDPEL
jgi:hypothetical protein